MTPLVRVCAVASALLAAGCSSWTPSFDFLSSGANVSLTIESDPPGADARTSLGASLPHAVHDPGPRRPQLHGELFAERLRAAGNPGRPANGDGAGYDVAGAASDGYATAMPELTPNPVYAQLQPAPPPAPSRKGKGRPPKKPPQ